MLSNFVNYLHQIGLEEIADSIDLKNEKVTLIFNKIL